VCVAECLGSTQEALGRALCRLGVDRQLFNPFSASSVTLIQYYLQSECNLEDKRHTFKMFARIARTRSMTDSAYGKGKIVPVL
jgi:hypothetical protein